MLQHNDRDLNSIFDCASFRKTLICLATFLTKEIESSCVCFCLLHPQLTQK